MSLSFGIPSLDELIEVYSGRGKEHRKGTTSFAILGPDGTGKSVLALHLASRYHFDCSKEIGSDSHRPLVIYVSSDLQYDAALQVWVRFGLDYPGTRQIPFERTWEALERSYSAKEIERRLSTREDFSRLPNPPSGVLRRLNLRRLLPSLEDPKPSSSPEPRERGNEPWDPGNDDLLDFLDEVRVVPEVGFLDLAAHSAGDDWGFVNTLLGKLAQRRHRTDNKGRRLPHLVVIDSVAGFETFVGKLDAYGLEQSRRTRIAQCVRNAGAHCHLGFVVEESKETEHQPEEYVTDVVLRLRRRLSGASVIRTIEVEKARARTLAPGEHPFEILPGAGTSTGNWENADHPRCQNAYVHVHHSLSHRNYLVTADPSAGLPPRKTLVAPFGIRYLDNLLNEESTGAWGLESGTATALIGDTSTGKSALAERFLTQGLADLVRWRFQVQELLYHKLPEKVAVELVARIGVELQRPLIDEKSGAEGYKLPEIAVPTPTTAGLDEIVSYWKACLRRSIDASDSILSEANLRDTRGGDDKEPPSNELIKKLSTPKELSKVFNVFWPKAPSKGSSPRLRNRQLLDHYFKAGCFNENTIFDSMYKDKKAFLEDLFRLPHFQYPAVLLTTSDRSAEGLSDKILKFVASSDEQLIRHLKEDRDGSEWSFCKGSDRGTAHSEALRHSSDDVRFLISRYSA